MSGSTFPGGTSLSSLEVYQDAAADGLRGGTPHMHLVSTEAYVVVGGTGAIQTIDGTGFRETSLAEGTVTWFTPGTIHRAVAHDDLRIIVLMSNAGLPEAGDAVMTFPADVLATTYAQAASLGEGPGQEQRVAARRDLAVSGFARLREAAERGDDGPLRDFHTAAGALVAGRARSWRGLVEDGPLAQASRARSLADAVAHGDVSHLLQARLAAREPGEQRFGMCGRLRPYHL